jgi:hypothetical protein
MPFALEAAILSRTRSAVTLACPHRVVRLHS